PARGWVVAVPQSSEIGATPDAYTWNDRERVATELDLHFDRVKRATEVDASRIVLAGFSMGGAQAIALALAKRFTLRGVIAIAPWLPTIVEATALAETASKMLRAYVVMGDGDPSVAGARDLVAMLQGRGMRAKLDERPGLGHDYPEDMDATLVAALDFVTK
ncbi:MAG TPA: dienelactone hydrolase family protein, partial [Candidatus Acidoferrales bacterium]|nr:dienelactone hydrolase family protein [Candidatus Acidoferrales bacterium]